MSTPDAEDADVAAERAHRLGAALGDVQRAERADLAEEIARQHAADERIVAALARRGETDADTTG